MNNDYYAVLPLNLVYEEKYSGLSSKAILLYALFLNRTRFSVKNNNFRDDEGLFIYYSLSQIGKHLRCNKASARKVISELEGADLVKIKFQEQGRPLKIYVYDVRLKKPDTFSYKKEEKEVSFDVGLAEKRAKEGLIDFATKKNKKRRTRNVGPTLW